MTDHALTEHSHDTFDTSADRFLCLLLLAEVLLIAATWPLWTTIDRFPAVPLLALLCDVPVIVDQCCTAVLCLAAIAGCVTIFMSRSARRTTRFSPEKFLATCLLTAVASGCVLAMLNQHRLQPWHWLFILITAQALLLGGESRVTVFRLTLASIYIFAAVSRWGPGVDSGMSRQVLTVLVRAMGGDSWLRNESFVFGCCVAMSVVEFLTGVLLLTTRFRRWGVVAAIALHSTLILTLSPWGLNHHFGVLIWNAFLLIAVSVLFSMGSSNGPKLWDSLDSTKAKGLAAFVVLFPLSGLFGVTDNWLSWQVYSPRPEVVRVYVHEEFVNFLPPDVQPFVGKPAPLDVWCPVRIDRWSLSATSVPMYPEDRFQLAVVEQIVQFVDESAAIRVELREPHLLPWRPHRSKIVDRELLNQLTSQFVFNGRVVRSAGSQPTPVLDR